MSEPVPHTPLAGPPPAEVPLDVPPLIRVIGQVRFPVIASVEKQDFIAPFQEAVRHEYPVLRPEKSRGVVLGPEKIMEARASTAWRFFDASSDWRLTLAPDFLALETKRYTSRDDFMGRFQRVLEALEAHVDPKVVDRLGVRYIDRVEGALLAELSTLIRAEVTGILATPLVRDLSHALSETLFVLPDGTGQVTARWGLLPSGATVDPGAIEPSSEPSWLLDIDAFQLYQPNPRALEVDSIVAQARGFAERIYSIFRWVVTDEFLRRYGGQP